MPVIIDGYNLLHSIQKSSDDIEPLSDVQLCRLVGRYLVLTAEKGEIVFDGIGPPQKEGFENIKNLEVIFTGRHKDADSVIESKITASTSPRRLTVVSNDQRIRKAARARKAVSVKSETFWNDLLNRLNRKRKQQEPAEKRLGLDEGQTKQWLKLFGFEQ